MRPPCSIDLQPRAPARAWVAAYRRMHSRSMQPTAPSAHDLQPGRLVDHLDAELGRLLELRAGAGAGDDQVGLGRDRAGRLGAERLGLRLGLVARQGFEAAGEDHGLAGDRRLRASRRRRAAARPRRSRSSHTSTIVRLVEEIAERARPRVGADRRRSRSSSAERLLVAGRARACGDARAARGKRAERASAGRAR